MLSRSVLMKMYFFYKSKWLLSKKFDDSLFHCEERQVNAKLQFWNNEKSQYDDLPLFSKMKEFIDESTSVT